MYARVLLPVVAGLCVGPAAADEFGIRFSYRKGSAYRSPSAARTYVYRDYDPVVYRTAAPLVVYEDEAAYAPVVRYRERRTVVAYEGCRSWCEPGPTVVYETVPAEVVVYDTAPAVVIYDDCRPDVVVRRPPVVRHGYTRHYYAAARTYRPARAAHHSARRTVRRPYSYPYARHVGSRGYYYAPRERRDRFGIGVGVGAGRVGVGMYYHGRSGGIGASFRYQD